MKKCMLLLIFISIFYAVNVFAADNNFIINVKNKGDFDVFYHRSQTTGTAAILAGLIGAGIETGVSKSKDTNLETELTEKTGELHCHEDLINAFKSKLTSSGSYTVMDESDPPNKKSHSTVFLTIKDCGYKLANQENNMLSAFVFFKVKIEQSKSKDTILDESFMIKSNQQHQLNGLLDNTEIVKTELRAVLEKAGKRLANKIIYLK